MRPRGKDYGQRRVLTYPLYKTEYFLVYIRQHLRRPVTWVILYKTASSRSRDMAAVLAGWLLGRLAGRRPAAGRLHTRMRGHTRHTHAHTPTYTRTHTYIMISSSIHAPTHTHIHACANRFTFISSPTHLLSGYSCVHFYSYFYSVFLFLLYSHCYIQF